MTSNPPTFRLAILLLALAAPAQAADITVTLPAGDGFAVEDNTATIERLRVDEATGNISRNGALFVHTTGTDSTFVGPGAGNTSTTGFSKRTIATHESTIEAHERTIQTLLARVEKVESRLALRIELEARFGHPMQLRSPWRPEILRS